MPIPAWGVYFYSRSLLSDKRLEQGSWSRSAAVHVLTGPCACMHACMRRSIRCPGTLITRRQAVDLDLNEASQLRGQSGLKGRGMPGQVKFHFKGWASARMHALPPLLSIHGTKSGIESVTLVCRSRRLCPGWTPTVAFKKVSLMHIPQTQVRSKVA